MVDHGQLLDETRRARAARSGMRSGTSRSEPTGTIHFQLEDTLFWPDLPANTNPRSSIVSWSGGATRAGVCRQRCFARLSITHGRWVDRICVSTATSRARSCERCMKESGSSPQLPAGGIRLIRCAVHTEEDHANSVSRSRCRGTVTVHCCPDSSSTRNGTTEDTLRSISAI